MTEQGMSPIEELLPRYCEGLATEAECRTVEDWMAQSDENYRLVKQVHALYMAVDAVHVMEMVDTERSLHRVHRRINHQHRVSGWQWAQRVAAILSLPLLMSTLWLYLGERPDNIQMLEAHTNPGMTSSLTLSDGTVVYLNSGSSVVYPSRFDDDNTRKVTLNGEAYFEVAKHAGQGFVVAMPHGSQIEVMGTRFNVEAYADRPEVFTTLLEGKVGFVFDKDGKREKMLMRPGQKLVYDSKNQSVRVLASSGRSETAWTQGKIIFHNTPLEEGLRMLEKRYDVDLVICNDKLKEYSFTGTFTNQRLERILEYFRLSSHIRWRYVDLPDITDERNRIEIY